jgi:hypothetical protein
MKGQKTGGRVKGSLNKSTSELRQKLFTIINNQFETFEKDFENLTSKEKFDIIIKLLPYAIPRLYNGELQIENINTKGGNNE